MDESTKDYGGKFSTSEVVVTFDFCLALCSDTCFIKIFFLSIDELFVAGEPFVNGQPVPYDPKYHEVYLENMERAKKFLMQQKKQRQQNPGLPFMGGGFQGMTGQE